MRLAVAERKDLDMAIREKLALDHDSDVKRTALQIGGFSDDFYARFFEMGGRNLPARCINEIGDEKVLDLVAQDLGARRAIRSYFISQYSRPYIDSAFCLHDAGPISRVQKKGLVFILISLQNYWRNWRMTPMNGLLRAHFKNPMIPEAAIR